MAERHHHCYPEIVSIHSTKFILDLQHQYSGVRESDPKIENEISAANGTINGLRWVYQDFGHMTIWSFKAYSGGRSEAFGNPSEGNSYLSSFRKIILKNILPWVKLHS